MVIAGVCDGDSYGPICTTRLNTDGSLDLTFDGDGRVLTPMGLQYKGVTGVAVQDDAKPIISLFCYVDGIQLDNFCAVRLNTDGSLDASFGGDGIVNVDLLTDSGEFAVSMDNLSYDIALQEDGKILISGACVVTGFDLCILRLNADGEPDTTFGNEANSGRTGWVTTPSGQFYVTATGLAVQDDGKILAVGNCGNGGLINDFCVVRYTADGMFDPTYGISGLVRTEINGTDLAYDVAIQADGKAVVGGVCSLLCIARYDENGALDLSFNGTGTVINPPVPMGVQSLALQQNGKILASGVCPGSYCVSRWNPDGTLDTTFGSSGWVGVGAGGPAAAPVDSELQGDGKLVVAGYFGSPGACAARFIAECASDDDCDGNQNTPATLHSGPANTLLTVDNCAALANPTQLNTDGNYVDNSPPYGVDDKTWIDSDAAGDACDADDDNDGISDTDEGTGATCAGKITNPLLQDTDGDRALDRAECVLLKDPTSALSKPTLAECGVAGDADGDRLSDRVEFCYYDSNPSRADSDGDKALDGATDGCEATSFNPDRVVNIADTGILASGIVGGALWYQPNIDVNKDGTLNIADVGLVASFRSPSGQCPG